MILQDALSAAAKELHHIDEANSIIYTLASESFSLSKEEIWAHPDREITQDQYSAFFQLVIRAKSGEPLSYLLQKKEFYGRNFFVTQDTLIPRPETECLVDKLIKFFSRHSIPHPTLVDVGTGSGNIAVTLALEIPHSNVMAVDVSSKALKVAKRNADYYKVRNITFLTGSLLAPLQGHTPPNSIHAIAANLPYISDDEYDHLPDNVKHFEPEIALRSGSDPDVLNRLLLDQASHWLRPEGIVVYETTNGRIETQHFPKVNL